MNLVLLGPVAPFRGGIAHFTTSLATASARDHTVTVVSFRRLYPRFLYPGTSDRDPGGNAFRLTMPVRFLVDVLQPLTWFQAGREIAALRPDLVVIQWWTTFLGPCWAVVASVLRSRRVPVTFLVHNVLPHEPRPFDRLLARLALSRGTGFVVLGGKEENRLREFLGTRVRIGVCPLPVSDFFGSSRQDRRHARAALGLPLDRLVLLFFGFVRPYKGLTHLIEAVGLLHERGRSVSLIVAGEFWEDRSGYERQVGRLGIADSVRFDDRYIPDEEVGKYFSAADIFIAPYIGGTQSASLTVALDFGLPVIATEPIAFGLNHLAGHGLRIVPPADPGAIADAVEELIVQRSGPAGGVPRPDAGVQWSLLVRTLAETIP